MTVNIVAIYDGMKGNHVVLKDVHVNGEYFRDHAWIKPNKRIVTSLKRGDMFTATAVLHEYLDSSDVTKTKTGLKHIRNIQELETL